MSKSSSFTDENNLDLPTPLSSSLLPPIEHLEVEEDHSIIGSNREIDVCNHVCHFSDQYTFIS